MARGIALLFLTFSLATFVKSEPLVVSVLSSVEKNYPYVVEKVSNALSAFDIEFSMIINANKRSLLLSKYHHVDIEIFRTPFVMTEAKNLIKLEPHLVQLKFSMFTSASTQDVCSMTNEGFSSLTVAGLHGVELYQQYFAPKFASYTSLIDVSALIEFISLGRADVGFLPTDIIERNISVKEYDALVVCPRHDTTFQFHAYLHKRHEAIKDRIEAALRTAFP